MRKTKRNEKYRGQLHPWEVTWEALFIAQILQNVITSFLLYCSYEFEQAKKELELPEAWGCCSCCINVIIRSFCCLSILSMSFILCLSFSASVLLISSSFSRSSNSFALYSDLCSQVLPRTPAMLRDDMFLASGSVNSSLFFLMKETIGSVYVSSRCTLQGLKLVDKNSQQHGLDYCHYHAKSISQDSRSY